MVSGTDGTRGGNYFRHANLIREWRAAIHMLSNAKKSIKIQKIFLRKLSRSERSWNSLITNVIYKTVSSLIHLWKRKLKLWSLHNPLRVNINWRFYLINYFRFFLLDLNRFLSYLKTLLFKSILLHLLRDLHKHSTAMSGNDGSIYIIPVLLSKPRLVFAGNALYKR